MKKRSHLRRWLGIDENYDPFFKISAPIAQLIKERLKSCVDSVLIVEYSQSKIVIKTHYEKLTVGLVAQKSNQYIYWQHSDFIARQNYRNFRASYSRVSEIREILKSNGYDITFDSLLGRKDLKVFSSTSVDATSNLIIKEINRIEKLLSSL